MKVRKKKIKKGGEIKERKSAHDIRVVTCKGAHGYVLSQREKKKGERWARKGKGLLGTQLGGGQAAEE